MKLTPTSKQLFGQYGLEQNSADLVHLTNTAPSAKRTEHEELNVDYTFLAMASFDPSLDDESDSDENDILNLSCHGTDLKRMRENPKLSCDESTIKRRKLQTQLDLMNSNLSSMAFDRNETMTPKESFNLNSSGPAVTCDKCPDEMWKARLNLNLATEECDKKSSPKNEK